MLQSQSFICFLCVRSLVNFCSFFQGTVLFSLSPLLLSPCTKLLISFIVVFQFEIFHLFLYSFCPCLPLCCWELNPGLCACQSRLRILFKPVLTGLFGHPCSQGGGKGATTLCVAAFGHPRWGQFPCDWWERIQTPTWPECGLVPGGP